MCNVTKCTIRAHTIQPKKQQQLNKWHEVISPYATIANHSIRIYAGYVSHILLQRRYSRRFIIDKSEQNDSVFLVQIYQTYSTMDANTQAHNNRKTHRRYWFLNFFFSFNMHKSSTPPYTGESLVFWRRDGERNCANENEKLIQN